MGPSWRQSGICSGHVGVMLDRQCWARLRPCWGQDGPAGAMWQRQAASEVEASFGQVEVFAVAVAVDASAAHKDGGVLTLSVFLGMEWGGMLTMMYLCTRPRRYATRSFLALART